MRADTVRRSVDNQGYITVQDESLSALDLQEILVRHASPRTMSSLLRPRALLFTRCTIGQQGEVVDLKDLNLLVPLKFENCCLPAVIDLRGAATKRIEFRNSRLSVLRMSSACVAGDLVLDGSCFTALLKNGGTTHGVFPSIQGQGMKICGKLSLKGCIALAGAHLSRAIIEGSVNCSGAFFMSPGYAGATWEPGDACGALQVAAAGCRLCFRKIAWARENALGDYRNVLRVLKDLVSRQDAAFLKNYQGYKYVAGDARSKSLDLYNCRIGGNVDLNHGFTGIGQVSLNSATVDAALHCDGSLFFQEHGVALSLDGLKLRSSMFFRSDSEGRICLFHGTATMRGAKVGHRLVCDAVTFHKPLPSWDNLHKGDPMRRREGYAFFAKNVEIGSDVAFNMSEEMHGDVTTEGKNSRPIHRGDTGLPPRCGRISFEGAEVRGRFLFAITAEPVFLPVGEQEYDPAYVNVDFAYVHGLAKFFIHNQGFDRERRIQVSLRDARFGSFDLSDCDPEVTEWDLDGLRYDSLRRYDQLGAEKPGSLRSTTLQRTQHSPSWVTAWTRGVLSRKKAVQPYDQFIKTLREAGEEQAAKVAAIERENNVTRRLREPKLTFSTQSIWVFIEIIWRYVLKIAGYGYLPARAFCLLVIWMMIGAFMFHMAKKEGHVFPTKAEFYTGGLSTHTIGVDYGSCGGTGSCEVPLNYPSFNPIFYSMELATPLPQLGLEEHWDLKGSFHEQWGLYEVWKWVHIIVGWTLSVAVVVSPISLLRKDW